LKESRTSHEGGMQIMKESSKTSHGGGMQIIMVWNEICRNIKKAVEPSNLAVCSS
jgi:hypothetical protein